MTARLDNSYQIDSLFMQISVSLCLLKCVIINCRCQLYKIASYFVVSSKFIDPIFILTSLIQDS